MTARGLTDAIEWSSSGGTLTLLPSAGRMLQATVAGHDALWRNADWDGTAWNVGGDRLWLGPEVNWFWTTRHSDDPATAVVQEGLDPGAWRVVEQSAGHCFVAQTARVRHLHRGATATFELSRSFHLEDVRLPLFSEHLAYRVEATATAVEAPPGEQASLWTLLQVPNGGVLELPNVPGDGYRHYFGSPDGILDDSDDVVSLRITGSQRYKIGVASWATNGRAAYHRAVPGGRLVILHLFSPQPWRPYADRPQLAEGDGDALEAYNDGGEFGGFGEVEHHSPALTIGGPDRSVADTSLTIVGVVAEDDWAAWRQTWLLSPTLPSLYGWSPART